MNSDVLRTTLSNLYSRFGISATLEDISSKAVAVATVSAELPAFVQPSDRMNVNVSSLRNARELVGGVVLQMPLTATNGRSYTGSIGQPFNRRRLARCSRSDSKRTLLSA